MTARELEAQSLVDPLLVAHLDEDWAVPCERQGPPACVEKNPAAWVVIFVRCCPEKERAALWCSPCLELILRRNRRISCRHCSHIFPSPREAYERFEPLNRRTT